METLKGKIALVTGGSRGIGAAVALALAGAGADVAVNFRTRSEDAEKVCVAIRKLGRHALAVQADVSQSDQVKKMVAQIEGELGAVNIVVNNAGIARQLKLEDIAEADWEEHISVNLKSAFLVTQAVLPQMRAQRWGRIINISSTAAQTGGLVGPHYAASKAGMLGLTHSYAALLAQGRHYGQHGLPGFGGNRHAAREPPRHFDRDSNRPLRHRGRSGVGSAAACGKWLHDGTDRQSQRGMVSELI